MSFYFYLNHQMLIYISHNKNTANLNQCCCCFSANVSNFVITQKHQLINWDKAMNENNEIFRLFCLFWIYNIIIIYNDSMADVKVVEIFQLCIFSFD